MRRCIYTFAALVLGSCSGEMPASEAVTSGITTVVLTSGTTGVNALTSTNSTSSSSTSSSTGGKSSASTDDLFPTTGTPPDFDSGKKGCGKIDLVFVLERDASMENQQAALAVSFPKFLQTIETMFAEFDLHIMVVNADTWIGFGIDECVELCAVNGGQGCAPEGPADYPCWAYSENALNECDDVDGAGVTFPAGFGAANKRCELSGGNRYILDNEPNFPSAFMCLTQTGVTNKNQAAAGLALQTAFMPELLGPGGCNEGFVRDDALLVITLITDNFASGIPGTPEEWAAPLIAAKGGDKNAIVMLGLSPDQAFAEEPLCGTKEDGWVPPTDELLGLFPNLVRGSVCEPDFSPFFDEAAALVLEVCESFLPR
jgi:hypothetical protein